MNADLCHRDNGLLVFERAVSCRGICGATKHIYRSLPCFQIANRNIQLCGMAQPSVPTLDVRSTGSSI